MATRADIRDAFIAELRTLSGSYDVTDSNGTVLNTASLDSGDIGLRHPETAETTPQIVYDDDYRQVIYNGVGAGPDVVNRDDKGNVISEEWREYEEGQFIVDVRASTESAKEPIYESLHTTFGKYQFGAWDESDLHEDIIDIDVVDSTSVDTGDVEDVIRGDQLEVRITFFREYTFSTDNIEKIITDIDVSLDDVIDKTYTTT